jgi:RNA polymerase sigma factor (sigma-70 family)
MPDRHLVALRGDEDTLYRAHHRRLVQAVRRQVNLPSELIEDACQTAWAILLRRQPERGPTLFAWLRTVAVHEAYGLSRVHRRDTQPEDEQHLEQLATHEPLSDQLEARRALRALAGLPDRQRRYATLRALGFSYEEIRRVAGGVTYTNVNKHLAKASARLRELEKDAA